MKQCEATRNHEKWDAHETYYPVCVKRFFATAHSTLTCGGLSSRGKALHLSCVRPFLSLRGAKQEEHGTTRRVLPALWDRRLQVAPWAHRGHLTCGNGGPGGIVGSIVIRENTEGAEDNPKAMWKRGRPHCRPQPPKKIYALIRPKIL